MREAVLRITIPDNWMGEISRKYAPNIKFIKCMPDGRIGGRWLIEIDGARSVSNKIVEDIKNHPDIQRVETFSFSECKLFASVIADKCSACRALAESDCYLVCAQCLGDGKVEWRLITGNIGSLARLIENLENYGYKVELLDSNEL